VLRFGTDGVRGDADEDLPGPFIVALARATARVLRPERVLIGRDTRASGPRLVAELAAGLRAEGVTPVHLGVLPTPAIAFIAARDRDPAAIVSASHNPWRDNGVKVIGADGCKLPDGAEDEIEAELEALVGGAAGLATEADAGTGADRSPALDADTDAADAYVEHLLSTLGGRGLDGLDVVVDCAHGAGFDLGPRALRAAGARVRVLHAEPDGRNINDHCGSTHPESLQAAVVRDGAQLGLALDGDGDRVLAVDECGELVDGDQIMTMCAIDTHARGGLRNDAIAVTVMSNLGLRRALRGAGVEVFETPVGDRHVVAAMQEHDLALGGEQSGHIVFADFATTGDGLLTGLQVADLVTRTGRPLSALAAQMRRVPQVLVNVRVAGRVDVGSSIPLADAVERVERELGEGGRVLVRGSGTEPLVRIMIEADEQAVADGAAERLRAVVTSEFGADGTS
jgi:phosphoglucosamine mutase